MARELQLKIVVDDSGAIRVLTDNESALKKISTAAEGSGTALGKFRAAASDLKQQMIPLTVAAGAAYMSIQRFVSQAQDYIKAASEQQDATAKLTTALQSQGSYTPDLVRKYGDLASAFQRTTTYGDELVLEMQALLVQIGNVMPEQMEGALRASTDLAAGLGVDLRTATLLVGKAFAGQTDTLSRYGIVIDQAKAKTDPAVAVMEALAAKFGGQAQAAAQTYTGQMQRLGNQIGDVKEVIGELMIRAIVPLAERFAALSPTTQTVIVGIGLLVGVLAPLGVAILGVVSAVTILTPLLGSLAVLLGPAGLVVLAIVGLAAVWLKFGDDIKRIVGEIYTAIKTWLVDPWGNTAAAIRTSIDAVISLFRGMKESVSRFAEEIYTAIKTWLIDRFQAIIDGIKAKIDAVKNFFAGLKDAVVGHSYVPDMIRDIGANFNRLDDVMVDPTRRGTSLTIDLFSRMGDTITERLSGLFGSGGILGRLTEAGFGGMFDTASGILGNLFGRLGQGGGMMQQIVSSGLRAVGDILIPGFGQILSTLGGIVTKGLKWIGDKFRALFGGPSAAELAGREVVEQFEQNLATMLTESQLIEAGNEEWKMTVIAIRDAYIAMGRSEAEALTDAERLWAASRNGPDAVNQVIQEITSRMHTQFVPAIESVTDALNNIPSEFPINVYWDVEDFPDIETSAAHRGGTITPYGVEEYHGGGPVMPWIRAHRGLATDEVPIIAQTGEGVLSRRGMRALGALNRGASAGGAVTINVDAKGAVFEDDRAIDRLALKISAAMGRRYAMSAGVPGF